MIFLRTFIAIVLTVFFLTAGTGKAQELKVNESLPAPAGFGKVSGCIPFMGFHYAKKATMPLGPILGYDEKGKLIFLEYMIAQKDFAAGKSWTNLPGLAGKSVHHIDIDFLAKGHEGFEEPHYDVHFYFVSHEEHMKICPPKKAT